LQRQIQKGSLATVTMDRSQKSNMTGERLNTDELRDCFTLKDERCTCDTRQKVENWPDYDGRPSLISQGCQDTVLLAVAAKEDANDSSLSFVHIVKDDDAKAHQGATGSGSKNMAKEEDCDKESERDQSYDCGINEEEIDAESGTCDEGYEFE